MFYVWRFTAQNVQKRSLSCFEKVCSFQNVLQTRMYYKMRSHSTVMPAIVLYFHPTQPQEPRPNNFLIIISFFTMTQSSNPTRNHVGKAIENCSDLQPRARHSHSAPVNSHMYENRLQFRGIRKIHLSTAASHYAVGSPPGHSFFASVPQGSAPAAFTLFPNPCKFN